MVSRKHDIVRLQPTTILGKIVLKSQNHVEVQYLVKWEGYSDQQASWEKALEFEAKYSNFGY